MYALICCLFASSALFAQQNVGIGTTTPHPSAALHVDAPNKGLLIPSVNLTSAVFPAPGPAQGLLVLNSNATFADGAGIYINSGTPAAPNWVILTNASSTTDGDWTIVGNNQYSAVSGNVGIGTTTPPFKLTVNSDTSDVIVGIGRNNFNLSESGRLRFQEDLTYNNLCGFEFNHNGAFDYLYLEAGCPTRDTLVRFTRYSGIQFPRRVTFGSFTGPTASVDIDGTLRYRNNPSQDFVLTSDTNGNATWTNPDSLKISTATNDGDWTISGTDQYSAVAGNVGIGTTTPSSKLHVQSSAAGDEVLYAYNTNSLNTTNGGSWSVKAEGTLGPTRAYLGVQGSNTDEFDNVPGFILDSPFNGVEVGGVFVSSGGSPTDNYAVYTHTNGWGLAMDHAANGLVKIGGPGTAGSAIADSLEIMQITSNDFGYQTRIAYDDRGTLAGASGHDFNNYNGTDNATGLLIESINGEGSGWYSDGDLVVLYSPGDQELTNFVDEDGMVRKAYVDGVGGAYMAVSDVRKKENIVPLTNSLEKLTQLNGYAYDMKLHEEEVAKVASGEYQPKRRMGVMAQEVETLFPYAVDTDKDGNKYMNYDGLIPVLIEAIKEQQLQIEELKKQIGQ